MFGHPEECPAIENLTLYIFLLYSNQQTKTNLYEINISKVHAMVDDLVKKLSPQNRQSFRLFLHSSELGLPHPFTRRRVLTHTPFGWGGGGGQTRFRE
jgi:hypothetical protein